MATYLELLNVAGDTSLNAKIRVATFVAATNIMAEAVNAPNHANRLLWAKQVFLDPVLAANRMLWPVLAQNKSFTVAQILAADDTAVQNAVNTAIDVFANGV